MRSAIGFLQHERIVAIAMTASPVVSAALAAREHASLIVKIIAATPARWTEEPHALAAVHQRERDRPKSNHLDAITDQKNLALCGEHRSFLTLRPSPDGSRARHECADAVHRIGIELRVKL
ncbi:hypothetical protein ACIPUD_27990 [Bradyrhizobium sp. CAR08]